MVTPPTQLFDMDVPIDLKFPPFFLPALFDDTVLYQSSQNPDFGNDEFEAEVADTYNFRLMLTPTTFNGPPITVTIQVVVSDAP